MSVRLSVCKYFCPSGLGVNVIFSAPNWDIAPIFCVQIPFINEHLFCKYFVRVSVGNATKGFATYGCFHPCLCCQSKCNLVDFFVKIPLSIIIFWIPTLQFILLVIIFFKKWKHLLYIYKYIGLVNECCNNCYLCL